MYDEKLRLSENMEPGIDFGYVLNCGDEFNVHPAEMLRTGMRVGISLDYDAIKPSYAHCDDSGADIFCKEDITIPANALGFLVKTGIRFSIPLNHEVQIRPKSGVSINSPIRVVQGTVDRGYTGEIGVIMDNLSDNVVIIPKGTAIAQAVLQYCPRMHFVDEEITQSTERGDGGFGSTGRGL